MSISQLFPEEGPTLNLNFAGSKTLDPRITFSRTSIATYMDDSGLIKVAPADAPRFDHRYVNGEIESLGLLVEEQRTNSLYYSNDFSQNPPVGALQGWLKQNSHPVPTQDVVGPDGVSNSGWRFYRTNTNQYIYQQVLGAGTHTLSAWVRSSAITGSFTMQAWNGIDAGMAQQFTATNEWQRFSITISPTTTTNYYPCIPANTNEDFYVWGAQLELNGSFPTSYIPTSGGTTTRNPDNVSMVGDNFSDWYNQSEGTIYVRGATCVSAANPVLVQVDDGANNQRLQIRRIGASGFAQLLVQVGGVTQGNPGVSGFEANTYGKVISAYKKDDLITSFNGTLSLSVTSAEIPITLNRMTIGNATGLLYPNSCISQLTYYPVRLPNSTLQTLTK